MHYSTGLGSLSAFGGALSLPGHGILWLAARLLLDTAGALFGLYLVTTVALLLAGQVMRLHHGVATPAQGRRP